MCFALGRVSVLLVSHLHEQVRFNRGWDVLNFSALGVSPEQVQFNRGWDVLNFSPLGVSPEQVQFIRRWDVCYTLLHVSALLIPHLSR